MQHYYDGVGIALIDVIGGDPHWKTRERYLPIKITYDKATGTYISKAMPKVKIAKRRFNAGLFSPSKPCLDIFRRVQFTFEDAKGRKASWELTYSVNPTLAEVTFPDGSRVFNMELK